MYLTYARRHDLHTAAQYMMAVVLGFTKIFICNEPHFCEYLAKSYNGASSDVQILGCASNNRYITL